MNRGTWWALVHGVADLARISVYLLLEETGNVRVGL